MPHILIYEEAIKNNPLLLEYLNEDEQTETLCILGIKKDPRCIKYIKCITEQIKKLILTYNPNYL